MLLLSVAYTGFDIPNEEVEEEEQAEREACNKILDDSLVHAQQAGVCIMIPLLFCFSVASQCLLSFTA